MRLTPAQIGMAYLLGLSVPMDTSRDWTIPQRIRRGRERLAKITHGQDFGYDALRWHEYLWATDAGAYKWCRRSADKWARQVQAGMERPEWLEAVRQLEDKE